MEYRFPIWYVQRGLGSLPLFADRFYGVLFMDSGSVFGREEGGDLASVYQGAWDELTKGRMSVGAELRGRLAMGWAYWIIPRVSIAFPIMDKGRFSDDLGYRFEFSLGSPF
jgi:outer membrane protein assembly factor BamA